LVIISAFLVPTSCCQPGEKVTKRDVFTIEFVERLHPIGNEDSPYCEVVAFLTTGNSDQRIEYYRAKFGGLSRALKWGDYKTSVVPLIQAMITHAQFDELDTIELEGDDPLVWHIWRELEWAGHPKAIEVLQTMVRRRKDAPLWLLTSAAAIREVRPRLLKVALDLKADPRLRLDAIHGICYFGDRSESDQLQPLVADDTRFVPMSAAFGLAIRMGDEVERLLAERGPAR
jgi:hypothetical protein